MSFLLLGQGHGSTPQQSRSEAKIDQWVAETGRLADELVEDGMAGYFDELAQVRGMLDNRYDDLKNGKVQPIDGEAFFENLRQREEELLKRRLT